MHAVLTLCGAAFLAGACRQRVSPEQCDALVARYAELVVRSRMPEASPELIAEAQRHVRDEAARDEGFRRCTSDVAPSQLACAMSAATPDAVEKCLE